MVLLGQTEEIFSEYYETIPLPVDYSFTNIRPFPKNPDEVLPNCPPTIHSFIPQFILSAIHTFKYPSKMFGLRPEDNPPIHLFTKSDNELTDNELEEIRSMTNIVVSLLKANDICDKVGIIYIAKILQAAPYIPTSSYCKDRIARLYISKTEVIELATQLFKEKETLLDDSPITVKEPPKNPDKVLPNCPPLIPPLSKPQYLEGGPPRYASKIMGLDPEYAPPINIFTKNLDVLTYDEKIKLELMMTIFIQLVEIDDKCDKVAIMYIAKILHSSQYISLSDDFRKFIDEIALNKENIEIVALAKQLL